MIDEFPVHVPLQLWLVYPNLERGEQGGYMSRYILVDYACPDDQRAVIVLVEDPEEPKEAIRLRPQMTNLLLYIQIGKTVKSTSEDFVCTTSHNGRTFSPGSCWPVFHGMKIKVVIQEVKRPCRDPHKIMCLSGIETNGTNASHPEYFDDVGDDNAFMQFLPEAELSVVDELVQQVTQTQSFFGIIGIHPEVETSSDILRAYIHDRKGQVSTDAFTVYVWMLQMPQPRVVHTAQRCAMLKAKSYTASLLLKL